MAQLVERSVLTLKVRGSNPVIGKINIEHLLTVKCVEKTKIKKKRPGIAHFLKKNIDTVICVFLIGQNILFDSTK